MEISWNRIDIPGQDKASLNSSGGRWHLKGVARFRLVPQWCELNYEVICDKKWRTLSAEVLGTVGDKRIEARVLHDPSGTWSLNGRNAAYTTGCTDFDLEFSPATNLIPIRRLNLSVGKEARIRSAWLRFPTLNLEPLEQLYRRTGKETYHYETNTFVTDFTVNRDGFVIDYPGFWRSFS